MFDAALASDNPAVKKALRNFMMVAAIVHAQELNEDERLAGPFETLLKKVQDLESMVYRLTKTSDIDRNYQKNYYGNSPTWVYNPNTSTTSISGTSNWNESTTSVDDIYNTLKGLKFT